MSCVLSKLIYNSAIHFIRVRNGKECVFQTPEEDNKFYSVYDVKYCIELLKNNKKAYLSKLNTKTSKPTLKQRLISVFQKRIYTWNSNFRFSSRVINSF